MTRGIFCFIILVLSHIAAAQEENGEVALSPMVTRLLEDDFTSDAQKRELKIIHGQWDDLTDLTPNEAATIALLRYDLDAIKVEDHTIDVMTRARAAYERGEPDITLTLLADQTTAAATWWRAASLKQLGQTPEAIALLEPWRDKLNTQTIDDPRELNYASRGLVLLARLQGRPSQDYHLAARLLAKVRNELDPLNYETHLAEAELLIDKANRSDAAAAFNEALTLNPKLGDAWLGLGKLHAESFNFTKAEAVVEKLREIHPDHPLAAELETFSLLRQRDVAHARQALQPLLDRYPKHRMGIALEAAAEALTYNDSAMHATLNHYDALSPASAEAYFVVGDMLSLARQYEDAAAMFNEAIEREPNWAQPRIELGLLLMQAGDLPAARAALDSAARLDRFNVRAVNQLKLVEEILGYERLETDHFIITYKAGPDAALARDMPAYLEQIYDDITAAFEHQPKRKTQIDIMPDTQRFAVRITGMPDIWTIAASTGDVISLTPPKSGPNQHGPFDWANVIRHEYVHTVTLAQTKNRIPHWFTEACAVSQELTPRDYETCELLAWALREDKLFGYREVNWGFIRPAHPYSRPLAYAQSNWMLEYITRRFGHRAIVALLTLYGEGVGDVEALKQVTKLDPDTFMADFTTWANEQVNAWGLGPQETTPAVQQIIEHGGENVSWKDLLAMHEAHREHVKLLRIVAQRAMSDADAATAQRLAMKYAQLCPVDLWPHRAVAALMIDAGKTEEAIASIEQLDRYEADSGKWAVQLAAVYEKRNDLPAAASAIRGAIRREPYNANYRQSAATIALKMQDFETALHHLRATADLEPDRAIHFLRLAAIYQKLEQTDAMREAAEQARAIDPEIDVSRFIESN